jgi:hypothetical protein
MTVIYRICSKQNHKSPVFRDNKFALVKMCLRSFVVSFEPVFPQMIFILDSCSEYRGWIEKNVPFSCQFIEETDITNEGSYRKQIEIAKDLQGLVMLQEDDYLYLPGAGEKIVKALREFEFVTPQDEMNYYEDERHEGRYRIRLVNDHHWRAVRSTTLTFATRGETIKKYEKELLKFGVSDYEMWTNLKPRLYAPVPTLATHMADSLAPCVDWSKYWVLYP